MARPRSNRPVGPTDGRFKQQRCLACHRCHRKCDGSRPCSACQSRKIICDSRGKPTFEAPFINRTPVVAPQRKDSISAAESIHINAFFHFVCDESRLPLLFRVLLPRNMIRAVHENHRVRTIVIAIGMVAWKDSADSMSLQLVELDNFIAQLCLDSGPKTVRQGADIDLLSALLIYIYLLMTDHSDSRLLCFADRVFRPLFKQQARRSHLLKSANSELLRLCSLIELRHAVSSDTNTFLADMESPLRGDLHRQEEFPDLESVCDSIIFVIAKLVPMNACIISSLEDCSTPEEHQDRQLSLTRGRSVGLEKDSENGSPNEKQLWLKQVQPLFQRLLVLIGVKFDTTSLSQMLEDILADVAPDKTGTKCLIAVYGCVGILFLHRFSQDLPALVTDLPGPAEPPLRLSHSTARCFVLTVVTLLERRLATDQANLGSATSYMERSDVGLESVFYIEAINVLAMEVGCPTLRKRCIQLLIAIRYRGFGAATSAMHDIGLMWEVSPEECAFVCACSDA